MNDPTQPTTAQQSDQSNATVMPAWRHQLPTKPGGGLLALAMVDVILLMLAFILIGSGYMVTSGVYVDPPKLGDNVQDVVPKMVISLNADGELYFNDRHMTDFTALEHELSTYGALGDAQRPVILLRADKDADYPKVVQIIGATRKYRMRLFLWTEDES